MRRRSLEHIAPAHRLADTACRDDSGLKKMASQKTARGLRSISVLHFYSGIVSWMRI